VKAGSGALRVLAGAETVPVVGVLAGGVLAVLVVGCVAVAWVAGGVPATDTVFVCEPHAPSSAPAPTPMASASAAGSTRLIAVMVFAKRPCPPRFPPAAVAVRENGRSETARPAQLIEAFAAAGC
jgi:hypothetical protein